MNTKRLLLCALVLTLICCSGTAFAANTVVIPSQSVAKGATGVVIPVMLTNDVDLISVIVPLAIREQTPGAFITSMSMGFGDRLPAGGPLSEISFRNQYADEDGNCKDNNPGGFGTITFNDGATHPVAAAPEGALFVRQKLFTPNLTPGADVTGSYFLTVDVTSVDGTFEIDTTCANPANHLLFARVGNLATIPDFTKGIITIGTGGSTNQPPVAVCQDVTVEAGAGCQTDVTTDQVDNGSSDPDSDPITFALVPAGPYPLGQTAVQLIVTDNSGDADTCDATITVEDTTPPVITACPGDVSVQCSADVPPADIGLVTATDNCAVTITHQGDVSDNNSCPETITRTYRATDAGGNFVDCTQTITVDDTEAPSITVCAPDISVQCEADVPAADIGLIAATDNCGAPTVTWEGDTPLSPDACGGTIARTYRATDGCGNFVECTQTITVDDTEAPVITACAPDISVQCEADVPAADIGLITATDNCGSVTITFEGDGPLTGGACGGTITRTYAATDDCGNSVTCTQTITVNDTENPTLVASVSNLNLVCPSEVPPILETDVTFTDNCGTPTVSTSRVDNGGAGSAGDPLIITDTYVATDGCGNTAQVGRIITVADDTPPSLTCPGDITVQEDSPGAGAVVNYADPTYSDNCAGGGFTQVAGLASGATFPLGTTTNTFEATDAAGNTSQCSFDVTVSAGIPPLVALCQDITVEAGAGCVASVAPEQVDNGSSGSNITLALDPPGPYALGANSVELVVSDDQGGEERCPAIVTVEDTTNPVITSCPGDVAVQCSGDIPPADIGAVTATDDCPVSITHEGDVSDNLSCPETITRTYRATDGSGNFVECTQIITVEDTEVPTVVSCASDLNLECPADIPLCDPANVEFTDNCGVVSVECNRVETSTGAGSASSPIVYTDTYTATDACGNTAECSRVITVIDDTPPTLTCPGDITTLEDTPGGGAVVHFADPTYSDNCIGGDFTQIAGLPSGATFPLGTTTNTFEATDAAGNTSTCSFDVTVTVELVPPVAQCTDVTVDAGENCEADASIDNGSYDPDGGAITLSQDPPGPYPLGTTAVTLTVTDNESDQSTCTANVTVVDNTPPVVTCAGDITASNDPGECGALVDYVSTVDDNCPGATLECVPASGTFFPVGATTVTCTGTDAAGNTTQCSFTVTVNDTEPPVVQCPSDFAVNNDPGQCGAVVNWLDGLLQTDNCELSSFTYSPLSGSFLPIGENVITGTGVDVAGNEASCTFTVTVNDVEAPTANCPGDLVIHINAPLTETVVDWTSTVDDNCPSGATIACVPASGSVFGLGVTPVECTATDAAGNTDLCSFTVTVIQDVNPVLDADPDTLYVSAIVDGPNPPPGQVAVNNIGSGGSIAYAVCEEIPWLDVNPISSSTDSFFDVAYDITGLTPGVYYGKICVSEAPVDKIIDCCPDVGLRDSVIVELTILAQCDQAQLVAEPSSLTFYSRDCARTLLCQTILIDSDIPDCPISWAAQSDAPWITVIDPGQETTPTTVQVCVDPSGLAPGIYHSSIDLFRAPDKGTLADLTIPVTLKIEEATVWMTPICGAPGEIVNVCVNYCTNVDLSGLSVGLCYDSDLIRVVDATFEGSAVQQYGTTWSVDDVGKTICLAAFPLDDAPIDSGCGLFATVHFEILGGCPDGATVNIDQCLVGEGCELIATDTELESFCTNFEPGTVCVECPCSICGTVYETDDGVITNALVQLWDHYPGGTLLDEVLTNEGGGFCFTDGVESGIPYDLRIVAEGYCTKIWNDISCGGDIENIALDPLPEIPSRPYSASWWSHNATNEGSPLLPGDVILAMDPQGNIVGLDIVSVPGEYLIDVVSDDPNTPGVDDGANEGEAITLYLNCVCPLPAPGEWHAFGDIQFDADFDCRLQPVEIPLCDSWTLVSFNVLPPNPQVGPVLSSIDGLYDYLLSATCTTGNDSWAKDRPTNDLNTLDPWHGFWIKPSTAGVGPVVVLGSFLAPDTPLDLCEGWNVISYLPGEPDDLAHALQSIDGKYTFIISSECDGPHSWAAERDPVNNDLYCLKPGHGYWIYVTEPVTLTYPTSGYSCSENPLSAGISSRATLTPLVTDFWSSADASVTGLREGDHLTVRTQTGAVCGETVVGVNGMFLVHVFGDDPTTDLVDGAHEGENLIFEVNGVAATVANGVAVYHEKRSTEITVQAAGTGPLPRDYALLQNYPNPFNPSTTIAFRMPEAADVTITVYNVLGQPVRTVFQGHLEAGSHTVEWDGRFDNGQTAQSGIYLYRMQTDRWSDAKKMTLVK